MNADEILKQNMDMFRLTHGGPPANEMCAEKITLDKVMAALVVEMQPIPTGEELWGMKIYVDETVPEGKVRFKLKGVTVAEVFAFEPKKL